jgi:uncharacterized protein (DUF1015 family)
MVTFLPFTGLRPELDRNEDIGGRVSPPYDVISDAYLKRLQSMKHNVTRLTLMPENSRYVGSRKELDSWISEGALCRDHDSFYVYRQTFSDAGSAHVRTGIVGILRTEPYENGNVIPHEETFSKVKEDRLNLLRDMETHLESIFGIHEGFTDGLSAMIAKNAVPLYSFRDDAGVTHEFSAISDVRTTDMITSELRGQKMLIADGHHRYETALNYSLENPGNDRKAFVLATLVSSKDNGLVIWPTHRLLRSGMNEDDAVTSISELMEMKEVPSKNDMMAELGQWQMGLLFRSGRCFLCRYDSTDALWSLDTYVAQELIMKKVYGYDDGKVSVSYDADYFSAERRTGDGEFDLAIILNDPCLDNIWRLSLAGRRMPKKTTFFYPKIWSGFVFYSMF